MIVNLLFQDQTKKEQETLRSQSFNNKIIFETDIIRDLKLDILLDAMADDDISLRKLCKNILLHPLTALDVIKMRQEILKDAISSPSFFLFLYQQTVECAEQTAIFSNINQPAYTNIIPSMKKIITYSEIINVYIRHLEHIHSFILKYHELFTSNRLIEFCNNFLSQYSKSFLHDLQNTLDQLLSLKANTKIVINGHLGSGLKFSDISLNNIFEPKEEVHLPQAKQLTSFFHNNKNNRTESVIMLDNNRLAGHCEEITNSSLIWVVKILSDFINECKNLFDDLHEMFGFYTGAINLYNKSIKAGIDLTIPTLTQNIGNYEFQDLTDIGLVLKDGTAAVGNSLCIANKKLCIITGSNQGGKTTFLRSLGLAQIMSQSGLFVAAASFKNCIYHGIYTHFPNEEDKELKYGLLEEELNKLNELVINMQPGSLLLMNESFSTTTEYDASILAEQITTAFADSGIITFFVTHLYEYANKLYLLNSSDYSFFRAGRNSDGSRTYLIEEAKPLKSSYAFDLYQQVFYETNRK